ncbi:MAG: hypothetical protein ACYDD6_07645, partial [Acidimicrobiales bacterium]
MAPALSTVAPPTPASAYQLLAPPPARVDLVPGRSRTEYFGTVLAVRSLSVPLRATPEPGALPGRVRVGLLSPDGRSTRWLVGPRGVGTGATLRVTERSPVAASGMVVEQVASGGGGRDQGLAMGDAVVTTAGQGTYRVDGALRDAVSAPRWRFAGMISVFPVFTQPSASGRAWVAPAGAGSVHVVSDTPWGTETLEVRTGAPVTLVRDVQFATGWQANMSTVTAVSPKGDAPVAVAVARHGLVQSVAVPAGTHLVTFRYRPRRVFDGLAASAVGVAAVLSLALWPRLRRRRRVPGASLGQVVEPLEIGP